MNLSVLGLSPTPAASGDAPAASPRPASPFFEIIDALLTGSSHQDPDESKLHPEPAVPEQAPPTTPGSPSSSGAPLPSLSAEAGAVVIPGPVPADPPSPGIDTDTRDPGGADARSRPPTPTPSPSAAATSGYESLDMRHSPPATAGGPGSRPDGTETPPAAPETGPPPPSPPHRWPTPERVVPTDAGAAGDRAAGDLAPGEPEPSARVEPTAESAEATASRPDLMEATDEGGRHIGSEVAEQGATGAPGRAGPTPEEALVGETVAKVTEWLDRAEQGRPRPSTISVELADPDGDFLVRLAMRQGRIELTVSREGADVPPGLLEDLDDALARNGFDLASGEERDGEEDAGDGHRRRDRRRQRPFHTELETRSEK